MKSMNYWKKKSLIHEQQQSSIRHSRFDSIDMVLPSSIKDSTDNTHPKPELPGYMLNSLSVTFCVLHPVTRIEVFGESEFYHDEICILLYTDVIFYATFHVEHIMCSTYM